MLIILDIQKKISNPVKEVFRKTWLKFHGRNGSFLNITDVKLIRPNHPTNCLTLDLIKIPDLNLKYLSQIQFSFLNMPQYQVEVKMEDRLYSLSRAYKYNKFGNSGPKMDLMNLSENMFRYYAVEFSQNRFIESDPGKKCKTYITSSFNDCDEQFIKKELERKYPPGFLPIWATDNHSMVTTYITGNKNTFEDNYTGFVSGTTKSHCPLPCTSTKISSVFIDEKYDSLNYSKIDILFLIKLL